MSSTMLPILVRLDGKMVPVNADLNWSIMQLKQFLYLQCNTKPEKLKIVFAGSELSNRLLLKNCQFAHGTVVHVIVSSIPDDEKQQNENSIVPTGSIAPSVDGISIQSDSKRERFYVYCKSNECNSVKYGKLRVCCKKCKDEAFELRRGPCSWEDVLKSDQINGLCNAKDCSGDIAEFFFKCSNSSNEADGFHASIPLPLVRTNIQDVPCLACTTVEDIILVFSCPNSHVICLECFSSYCRSKLDSRQYVLVDPIGYTLCCPGMEDSCSSSYIEEVHHFMIAGKIQYERYKNFATEEFVLQNGGIFCPGEGCGNGILTETRTRKVVCHKSRGGCGMVFCRQCHYAYHDDDCQNNVTQTEATASLNLYAINRSNALQAQWRDDRLSRDTIQRLTKQCPSCKTAIEKSGGCNHMNCPRCHFQWCWLCQVEWGRNCEADHWFRAR